MTGNGNGNDGMARTTTEKEQERFNPERFVKEWAKLQRHAFEEHLVKQECLLRDMMDRHGLTHNHHHHHTHSRHSHSPRQVEREPTHKSSQVVLTGSERSDGSGDKDSGRNSNYSLESLTNALRQLAQEPQKVKYDVLRLIEWFRYLEEPPRTSRLDKMVQSSAFESICVSVIVINCFFILFSLNYMANNLGQPVPTAYLVGEYFFSIFYLIEIVLRLVVHRAYFFVNEDAGWNVTDLLLVLLSTWHQLAVLLDRFAVPVKLNFLRSIRLMKLARLLRLVRVIRFFRDLRVIFDAFLNSIFALFWCLVLLFFTIAMFALVFVQLVTDHLNETLTDPCVSFGDDGECISTVLQGNFGSVERAMLTLYMATTGGNDWEVYWEMLKYTGNFTGFIFVFYTAFYFFGVFNLLTGMFVDKAVKATQPDVDLMNLERRASEQVYITKLMDIFEQAQFRTNGSLTKADFDGLVTLESMQDFLIDLGLTVVDIQVLFDMLMNADRKVPIDTFVRGCARMKGPATSMDLQAMLGELKAIRKEQQENRQDLRQFQHQLGAAVANSRILTEEDGFPVAI